MPEIAQFEITPRRVLAATVMAGIPALIACYLAITSGAVVTPAQAAPNSVTFPPLEQLEQYATVERGTTRELMSTSRAALDAIKAQQPVPSGTWKARRPGWRPGMPVRRS